MISPSEIPNLVGGVSQQADSQRFSSQATEQINGNSDAVTGLTKRPPTVHESGGTPINTDEPSALDQFVHHVARDSTNRYVVTVKGQTSGSISLLVNRVDGTAMTVKDGVGGATITSPDSKLDYLATADPQEELKGLTVADNTFLLNRTITPTIDTSGSPTTPAVVREAVVFVKQTRVQSDYKISLWNDPSKPGVADHIGHITTGRDAPGQEKVLDHLIDGGSSFLIGSLDTLDSAEVSDYTFTRSGALLHVIRQGAAPTADFAIEVECSQADSIFVFKDEIESFSKLPRKSFANQIIKIISDPGSDGDDYYVKFIPTNSSATGFTEGAWTETVAPGVSIGVQNDLMPHVLIDRVSDLGYFIYEEVNWDDRTTGDLDSNPNPSFVGETIKDIFFNRNRLGFLAGENIIMSAAGDFFRFFRASVNLLLDDDPIDVGSNSTDIAILLKSAVVGRKLVVSSLNRQFVMDVGDDILTPRTVQLLPATQMEIIPTVDPITVGSGILFGNDNGSFSGVNDYRQNNAGEFEPGDITSHVPKYIEGNIEQFVGSQTLQIVFARPDTNRNLLYVYKWFDRSGERLQSAWSKWDFGTNSQIRYIFLLDTTLYLVISRSGGTYIESIEIESQKADPNATFITTLDRRQADTDLTPVYNSGPDTTTFTLPYVPDDTNDVIEVARRGDGVTEAGTSIPVETRVGAVVTLSGDLTSTAFWVGKKYEFSFIPTRPYPRSPQNPNKTFRGAYNVREGQLEYDDTLNFKVTVTPLAGTSYSYTFNARNLSDVLMQIGSPPTPLDGTFKFPVMSMNDRVTITFSNDTPFPCKLLSLTWHGIFRPRA